MSLNRSFPSYVNVLTLHLSPVYRPLQANDCVKFFRIPSCSYHGTYIQYLLDTYSWIKWLGSSITIKPFDAAKKRTLTTQKFQCFYATKVYFLSMEGRTHWKSSFCVAARDLNFSGWSLHGYDLTYEFCVGKKERRQIVSSV